MNVLFVTYYFSPEVGAPQRRIREFAVKLKAKGHRVSVLTGFPNYPHGDLIPPYQRQPYLREDLDGVEVLRVFHLLGNRRGKLGRAVSEGSFAISATLAALLEQAPDVVVVESPSLLLGWAGLALKTFRRTSFVLHIADPVLVAAFGMRVMRKDMLFRILSKMENLFYRAADRIVSVSPGICRILREQGVPTSKVVEIPNGVDDSFFEQLGKLNLESNGRPTETRVVYAGNHGMAQGLNVMLETAHLFTPGEKIRFLLYGDGIEKPGLVCAAGRMHLANLTFFEPVAPAQMLDVLAQTDIWVVPLADNLGLEWAIPSKLLEGMAAGLPVVLSARGEAARLVQSAKAGLVVEPGRPTQLVEAIRWLRANPERAKKMGEFGRAYVRENFLRSRLTEKLEVVLKEAIEESRPQK